MTYPDPYGAYPAHRPVAPPKRKRRAWPWVLGAAFVVMCAIGAVANSSASSTGHIRKAAPAGEAVGKVIGSAAPANDPETEAAEPAATEDPMADVFTAGSYEIGKKSSPTDGTVKPGTFLLATTDHCYWERVKSFDGDFDSIIANGNLDEGETVRVTVKKSDKGINLKGDCVMGQKGGLK